MLHAQVNNAFINCAKTVNFLYKFAVVDASKLDNLFVDTETGDITLIDFEHVSIYKDETGHYHPLVPDDNDSPQGCEFSWDFNSLCNVDNGLESVRLFTIT